MPQYSGANRTSKNILIRRKRRKMKILTVKADAPALKSCCAENFVYFSDILEY